MENNLISKSVIFYLVNNNPIHLRRLFDSLRCLKTNFLNSYNYPVVFGYESIDQPSVKQIKSILQDIPCYFYNIKFELPNYSDEIKQQIPEKFKGHWDENAFFSMGYRHMCRFFAGDIYKHSFFDNVNYMLRLDCDSYFIDKVKIDLFKTMHDNNCLYGYVGIENDLDYVIEGLSDFCKNYFNNPTACISPRKMYQTHFEMVDFQWFRSKTYSEFFKAIDETGNIYIKRWGDAPIKYQAVQHLIPSTQIYKFDIPYRHGGDL